MRCVAHGCWCRALWVRLSKQAPWRSLNSKIEASFFGLKVLELEINSILAHEDVVAHIGAPLHEVAHLDGFSLWCASKFA